MEVGSLTKFGQISKLVIDEMQDLDHEELDKLTKILDENKIKFLGLMDSNQAIYNNPSTVAARLAAEPKLLDINLRNSVEIGKLADALYSGPPAELAGPPGVGVHISPSTGKDVAGNAKACIVNLKKEGVPSSYIAILCSDDDSVHGISEDLNHMGIETRKFADKGEGVIVESVSNFKGLEAPVVLVIADRNLSQSRELSYVAVSRARSSLYILGRFANTVLDNAIRQTQAKQDISPRPAS
jgi:DNA helicase IV